MGRASVPTPALYPAFFFVLEKGSKSAGNAVISTFPAHCPHGLQHLRHKRPTFAFTPESGYTLGFAQRNRTQRPTRRNRGHFGWGWYHYPRRALCGPEPLRAQRSEEHTLPSLHGPRERRREAESLRNGDAHRARLRSEAPRPRRVALLHCCFLRCTGKLRGSLSLRRRAERKIC